MLRQKIEYELSETQSGRPLGTEKITEKKYDVLLNRGPMHYHTNLLRSCYAGGSDVRIQPGNITNGAKKHEATYAKRGGIDDGGGAKELPYDPVEGSKEAEKRPLQPFSTRFKDGPVDKLEHAKLTKDSIEGHAIKCKPPDIIHYDWTR